MGESLGSEGGELEEGGGDGVGVGVSVSCDDGCKDPLWLVSFTCWVLCLVSLFWGIAGWLAVFV